MCNKVDISGLDKLEPDMLDTCLFNRDNGAGAAERAIEGLRA